MIGNPPEENDSKDADTPLPGAVMPLAEERKMVRKSLDVVNDNWSLRKKRVSTGRHFSDDDDHDQTVPV